MCKVPTSQEAKLGHFHSCYYNYDNYQYHKTFITFILILQFEVIVAFLLLIITTIKFNFYKHPMLCSQFWIIEAYSTC